MYNAVSDACDSFTEIVDTSSSTSFSGSHSHAHLKKGPYGVAEPVISRFIRPEDLDLVITPGVAFDKKGNRLGRGKGYYDRFLSKLPKDTPSIGLAFRLQILPAVPTTFHDVSVKKVLFA